MMKRILIALGIIAVLMVAAFFYLNYKNRTLSPPGKEVFKQNDLKIEIDYSRPSVRNRLIFGAAADGALQPYGSYWRLGANEATEISINKDVFLQNEKLPAGRYRLYAIPGAATFIIGVNRGVGKWGAIEPDYSNDVFRIEVPVEYLNTPTEKFTISVNKSNDADADIVFEWSDVRLSLPVVVQ